MRFTKKMNTKSCRILLSIEHKLWNELLQLTFDDHADAEIVGESSDAIECLALIVQTKPNIWIHSLPEGAELQLLEARARDAAPELVIVRVDPRDQHAFMRVPVRSITHMLALANQLKLENFSSYSAY